jgi:RNA polymerase sigma-70 factor (ECF subfamily)
MAKGDEDAYRWFFDAYFNRLLGYLLVVTRDEQRAREALQVTLLRVARHVKRFDSELVFWSWLTVLARSSVADESRRTRRYASILARFFERSEIETQAPTGESQARLMELLEANLAALPREDQELIERKYFEGDTVHQIAQWNRVSEKAIESRLGRIRQKLKDMVVSQLGHDY